MDRIVVRRFLLDLTHKENFPLPKEISFVLNICRLSAKEEKELKSKGLFFSVFYFRYYGFLVTFFLLIII